MPRLEEGGPGGGPIQYPPILQTLGLDYETNWTGSTHEALKTVEYTVTTANTFGDIPAAQDFASIYVAASHIYEATLRGIRDDLTAAAQALAQAGSEIRERDEASGDAFQTLQARWGDGSGSATTTSTEDAATDAAAQQGAQAQGRIQGAEPAGPTTIADPDVTTDPGASGTDPTVATEDGSAPTGGPTTPSSGMDVG